jgi:2-amino-4-hydroxy-6-hydroxymethyldihydropteridine diphosphokinase
MDISKSQPFTTYILLGTNLGDRLNNLRRARILISLNIGWISSSSKLYETAPWGELDQSSFLNQALCVKSLLYPSVMLQKIFEIEKALGKNKVTKWGPRTIDIDILLYDNKVFKSENLEIPHPRMLSRNFVLIPLSEIAGSVVHPEAKKTIKELEGMCIDNGSVSIFKDNTK